jgi:hypothetical protein
MLFLCSRREISIRTLKTSGNICRGRKQYMTMLHLALGKISNVKPCIVLNHVLFLVAYFKECLS